MATTELSISATPGQPHHFFSKALFVPFLPDLELTLILRRAAFMSLELSRSVDHVLALNRSLGFTIDITNE